MKLRGKDWKAAAAIMRPLLPPQESGCNQPRAIRLFKNVDQINPDSPVAIDAMSEDNPSVAKSMDFCSEQTVITGDLTII